MVSAAKYRVTLTEPAEPFSGIAVTVTAEVDPPTSVETEFAGEFLGAMHDDGAVLPEIRADTALQTFALVLLHHVKSPESAGAWLNLGLALRRMALYRTQDSEQVNRRRLCDALEALERSLQLDPDNVGKNIRAWTGESFAYHVRGLDGWRMQSGSGNDS